MLRAGAIDVHILNCSIEFGAERLDGGRQAVLQVMLKISGVPFEVAQEFAVFGPECCYHSNFLWLRIHLISQGRALMFLRPYYQTLINPYLYVLVNVRIGFILQNNLRCQCIRTQGAFK